MELTKVQYHTSRLQYFYFGPFDSSGFSLNKKG